MKKSIILAFICSMLLVSISGCGSSQSEDLTGASSSNSIMDKVKNFISGDVSGEINTTYSTQWFDFTVNTIKTAYEYGEYASNDGYKFVIVNVSETNTFDAPISMSCYDFNLDAEGLSEEEMWSDVPFDDRMMPEEFELDVGESAQYDIVFIIPDDIIDIRFMYVEVAEDESIGATFTINHTL